MGAASPTTTAAPNITAAPTTTTEAADTSATTGAEETTQVITQAPIGPETREHCENFSADCLTVVNNDMSRDDCEAALADPDYVTALQEAVIAEITDVIQTEFGGDFVANLSPSIWCGSLVIQVVVETFAPQLREHYSNDNVLELEVDGEPLSFEPQSTSTAATTPATEPSPTTAAEITEPTTAAETTEPTTAAETTEPSATTANAKAVTDEEASMNTLWIGVVAAGAGVLVLGAILVTVVAVCTSRKSDKSDDGEDEDVEFHAVTPRPVSKRMSDDPYETHIEMTEVADNDKKDDEPETEEKADEITV